MRFSHFRALAICGVMMAGQAILCERKALACENPSYCEPINVDDQTPSRSKQPPVSQLTLLGLHLHTNNVEDMRRRLGNAQFMHEDECGGRDFCFESADGDDPTTLIVEAWGPELVAFTVLPIRIKNERCIKSHLVNRALGTEGGLRLGMTLHDVEPLLGAPIQATPAGIAYSFLTRQRMTDSDVRAYEKVMPRAAILSDPFLDEWTVIQVGTQGSRVSCFQVQNTKTH
jgi:hypothetical protein